jgi:hypothetical protein
MFSIVFGPSKRAAFGKTLRPIASTPAVDSMPPGIDHKPTKSS